MAGEKPDAFAEQQAALNAPPPKKWVPSARAFGYAILLFLLFGVGASLSLPPRRPCSCARARDREGRQR